MLRRRDNKKAWKQKHLNQYDKEYHEIQRDKRAREIEDILKSLLECPKAGARFLDKKIELQNFTAIFFSFYF